MRSIPEEVIDGSLQLSAKSKLHSCNEELLMKSGEQRGFLGNDLICLSDDDDDEDGGGGGDGCEDVADAGISVPSSASAGGELPTPSTTRAATPSRASSEKGGGLADPAIPVAAATPPSTSARGVTSPSSIRPSTPTQGAGSPGVTSSTSTTTRRVASPATITPSTTRVGVPSARVAAPSASTPTPVGTTSRSAENANGSANERDERYARQRSQVRKRNSFVQTLLSTPGCVLVIDNLEVDIQPVDVLGQLLQFNNNKEKVHSVHIPPPYPELNRAVGYVVFLSKQFADTAALFLTRNFIVSARGRPWIVSRCGQNLHEEDFGFPTLSAFRGETNDRNEDSFGGLKTITQKQETEYKAAKKRQVVFEQHRKQTQQMFQRHAQEEKDLVDNPDLSLYQ